MFKFNLRVLDGPVPQTLLIINWQLKCSEHFCDVSGDCTYCYWEDCQCDTHYLDFFSLTALRAWCTEHRGAYSTIRDLSFFALTPMEKISA